ncbi:MAG TPA: histidinol dehydrogenase [Alphaproteobacteria bacterium]|nr:histidinol dehydrogenase [Alphaproteobacteria bacterium]HAJ45913.1 histidinol dehydrogenase [Alphaproteobacteria bacterium]
MAAWIEASAPDFEDRFKALLEAKRETAHDVSQTVAEIMARVRAEGDAAVAAFTNRFDGLQLGPQDLALDLSNPPAISSGLGTALRVAKERLEAFHARHKPEDDWYIDSLGVGLGARWTPVDAAALYVPGGTAAYPSSLLMNAVPAKVAGVARIVLLTPTPQGLVNAAVLNAARLCGLSEAYRIGGAQAVAALAYGTQSIRPVDKIVGPGNAYVAAAKRQIFGQVGIDSIAGPSEVVIVATGGNEPAWIAADLLAQAEHDTAAQSILITDDAAFGRAVMAAVDGMLQSLPRAAIAAKSWQAHGAVILVKRTAEAAALVDRLAPEHLQLAMESPHGFAKSVRHAGAIFLGAHTPEAIGDYVAGPNHVLPTARSARFSSGLSVLDFMKRTTLIECDAQSLSRLAPSAIALADAEGLGAHARSVAIRVGQ